MYTRSVAAWGHASVARRRALQLRVTVQERVVQFSRPRRRDHLSMATPSSHTLMVGSFCRIFHPPWTLIYIIAAVGLSSAPQDLITAPPINLWPNQRFSTQEGPSAPKVPYWDWDTGIESALALNDTGSHPGYAHIPASSSIVPGSEHHMHHDGHGYDSNNWPYAYADNFAGPSQST